MMVQEELGGGGAILLDFVLLDRIVQEAKGVSFEQLC